MRKRNKAFTLIEMLVAVSIFSIVAVSLYLCLANGIRINRKADVMEGVYRDARWVLTTLELDVENMLPYRHKVESSTVHRVTVHEATQKNVSMTFTTGGSQQELFLSGFIGDSSSLSMIAATETGFKQIFYYLEDAQEADPGAASQEPGGQQVQYLIRAEAPFPYEGAIQEQDIAEEILSRFVEPGGLRFSYAGFEDEQTGEFEWQENWAEEFLPAGIKMELALASPQQGAQKITISNTIVVPAGGQAVAAPAGL